MRYENEPEALFRVVPAEGGGLAVVAASGTDAVAYGFDPSQDEWRYPEGEGGRRCERLGSPYAAVPNATRVIFATAVSPPPSLRAAGAPHRSCPMYIQRYVICTAMCRWIWC